MNNKFEQNFKGEEDDDDEAQSKSSKSSKSKNVKKRKRGESDNEEGSENDEAESEVDNGSDEDGSKEHKRAKNRRYICQDKDGNFVPLAYVCADVYHKKTCRALFPHDPDDPHGRPPNCDIDEIKDVVYKCAHHCKVCCMLAAYGCGDDPTYDFDCESRKHLCEKLPKLMNIACPSSCGTCHIGPCKDTVDGCISMRSTMCKHHKEFNKDLHECARSCKLCTPRCVDLSDKCAEADQSACLRPPDDKPEENVYYKAMSRVCRKSCNLCDEPFDDLEESKLIETKLNNKRSREEDEDIISEVINTNDDGEEVTSKRRRINSNNDDSEMEDNESENESEVEDK
uniref:ShKT domain-containing protein n=1 Tax=Meloidogyne floridensis TaxID=298350 RepID=A0A915P215_9BILA